MTHATVRQEAVWLRLRPTAAAPQAARAATAILCSALPVRVADNAVLLAGEMVRSTICRQSHAAHVEFEALLDADSLTVRVRASQLSRSHPLALAEADLSRTLDLLRRLAQTHGYATGQNGSELWGALSTS